MAPAGSLKKYCCPQGLGSPGVLFEVQAVVRLGHRCRAMGISGDDLGEIFPEQSVRTKVSAPAPLKLLVQAEAGELRRCSISPAPRGQAGGPSCRLCDLHSALVSDKLRKQQPAPRDVLF